jgi:hypothetical protein
VSVLNSSNISFQKLTYSPSSELLFRIGGERNKNISVMNSNTSAAKQTVQFEFGAKESDFKIN